MDEPHLASAEFGGFWIRFFAVLVDSAIVFLVMVLLIVGAGSALGEAGLTFGALAAWLFAFLYWPVMHASKLQATLGKALLGLRVTGYQGNRVSFLRSLGRELAKVLSGAVAMVGYLVAAFTARKQALHDLVASTYVVRAGKARIIPALATMVAAFLLPVVVAVLGVGGPMVGYLMAMAKSMEQPAAPPVMKAAPRPPVVVAATPKPAPPPPPPAPVLT
ncbi:MAG: RDD family protein, partial [Burkholderiales bacterium]